MTGNLRDKMNHYYAYFATLRRGLSQVVWVEPYEDASGAGMMTTASISVYDESVDPPVLIGVVGVDVLTRDLEKVESNYENLLKYLTFRFSTTHTGLYSLCVIRSSTCPTLEVTPCELELLRMDTVDSGIFSGDDVNQYRCDLNLTCTKPPEDTCILARSYKYWCDAGGSYEYRDYEEQACCSPCLSAGDIAVIVILCVAFVAVVVILTVLVIRHRNKNNNNK
jgi:hypothetical protein